jgi:phospholipid/cholesterol/gamma-HCH transport system substrate-binding protein
LNLSREVKTAILILGCIVIFIFGFSYLKGSSLLKQEKTVHALYQDVEGLVVGANVTISGMNVGKVKQIDFDESYKKIKVTFSLREDLSFSDQSVAQLYEAGLIGGKAIAILPQYEEGNVIQSGAVLPSEIKPGLTELVNQQIAPLQDKIEGLLTSADSLFAGVSNVMNYDTQNNLKATLENFAKTIENINTLTSRVNRIVDANETELNNTLSNISELSGNLNQLTDSLSQAPLNTTLKNFEVTSAQLKKIIDRLESGAGSAGKLLYEDELYDNLLKSTKALELLLSDLQAHPKRYVHFSIFGKKEESNEKN